jgi:prepilin-type processing-associated H-X9-DG protein
VDSLFGRERLKDRQQLQWTGRLAPLTFEMTMKEQLLGYVLNTLDEETAQQVEAWLEKDPEARAQEVLLRRAVEPLGADRDDPDPPAGLAVRTIGRIAEHLCAPRTLPQAPAPVPASFSSGRSRWRRADFAVAASLFVVAGALVIAGVFHVREAWAVTACQNNLREFHPAHNCYFDKHGEYANVRQAKDKKQKPVHPENAVAGMVVPMLISTGCLDPNTSISCPGNGDPQPCPLSLEQLANLSAAEFAERAATLSGCYAYCLGYVDEGRNYHSPRRAADTLQATTPIMADCPPPDPTQPENSRNHGGRGQNVLFQDGHVIFLKNRFVGKDDIYLNNKNEPAAGIGADDIVLGSSATKPMK